MENLYADGQSNVGFDDVHLNGHMRSIGDWKSHIYKSLDELSPYTNRKVSGDEARLMTLPVDAW